MAALRAARRETQDVLLIEGGAFGTTCARVGCMPSKLLIAAANRAEAVRDAATFGIDIPAWSIDGVRVMQRVHDLRNAFVDSVLQSIEALPEGMILRGRARFVSDDRLDVETQTGTVTVEAERIVIATGSRPTIPEEFANLGTRATSEDVFEWSSLPASVGVFGAGVIGLELGQALSRLGVRVSLFTKDGMVGPLTDPALIEEAHTLVDEALEFVPDFRMIGFSETEDHVTIDYSAAGREFSTTLERVLIAVGRTPNVDGLALENTSLARDEAGIPLFDRATGRCGDSTIFIAGDAMDEAPLLHEATRSGVIAGTNAGLYPSARTGTHAVPLTIVFSEPQIALVGSTYRALDETGTEHVVGAVDFGEQGRAQVIDRAKGRLHLYVAKGTARLLGAEMMAPEAEHLAHILAVAIDRGMTVREMLDLPFYHPTLEEGLRTACCDALARLGEREVPRPNELAFGPGG
ncbi:dihydrolipoyl dehydrogenase [Acuticoccus sp. M5D2P5]|nr:dihydrolipoyl dehydrogenase [Acuticoccus kalidii]